MLRRPLVRRLIAVGIGVAAIAVPISAMAAIPLGSLVESNYEKHIGKVNRDCGYSQPLPGRRGQSIWLFCDTDNPHVVEQFSFLNGSTAALGPTMTGTVPDLSEVPTPPTPIGRLPNKGRPQHFLKNPTVLLPDGVHACVPPAGFSARWITGVAQEPAAVDSSKLLISFVDVCVSGLTITIEAFGLADYRPATNTVTSATRVFSEPRPGKGILPQLALGSPVFIGGKLYLFASGCTAKPSGACQSTRKVFLARTDPRPSSWLHAGSYQFFDSHVAGHFTRSAGRADSVIPGAQPLGISVGVYADHGLVLIEQTGLGGQFRVWTAGSSPAGPWHGSAQRTVPCGNGAGNDLCRAMIGHPDLSSRSQLVFSYFNANPKVEHLVLAPTSF